MTPWDKDWGKLPTAERINAVLLHAKIYPHKWTHIHYSESRAHARWQVIQDTPESIRRKVMQETGMVFINGLETYEAATMLAALEDALFALAAWHDCAYMLDLHPDVVRTLAGSGNHAAILLLPAILSMKGDDDGSHSTSTEGARPEAV